MPERSANEFFEGLAVTHLFTAAQLARLKSRFLPADDDGSVFIDALIDSRTLTRFQVRQIDSGLGRNLLLDHYELRDFLGKGGMGAVYLAWDRNHRRLCALKMLQVGKNRTDQRPLRRFQREALVSQRLRHPHIAVAYEAGETRGQHYLAMEFVPGPTLFQLVRRSPPIHPYWASVWMAEICGALDHAHQAGVIHRDLKPSNIIIMPTGQAKLLDLGLARWFDDDHNEEHVVGKKRIIGSVDYMAPEQAADSSRADARSDLYAVGCLLYFILAGRPPFAHVAEGREKLIHHRKAAADPITDHRPDVSAAMARILERLLAKEPAKRFTVAAELRDELGKQARSMFTTLPQEERVPPSARPVPPSATDQPGDENQGPIATESEGVDDRLPPEESGGLISRLRQFLGFR